MHLTLASGRKVTLDTLQQWRTYAGMLAGKPDARINRSHIEELLERASEYTVVGGTPLLIQPAEDALNARLPAVTCIAVFQSGELARKDAEPYSSLTVAWFQGAFALPISPDVEAQIRAVDWEAAAKDWMS